MKFRSGFVSNSSSSSFIAIGFLEKPPKFNSNEEEETWYESHLQISEGKYLNGIILADECREGDGLEDGQCTLKDIVTIFDDIYGKSSGVDISIIKLYYGVRPT